MTLNKRKPAGFTLIELLVVIAIITALLALMTAGIMKVMSRTSQARTSEDLVGLSQALETFKTDHGGLYPPSALNAANYKYVLQRLWPSINADKALASVGITAPPDLQGDQCLVLFLAGRHLMTPSTSSSAPTTNPMPGTVAEMPSGFSQNPLNPFEAGGARIGPYFKFDPNRLCTRSKTMPIASYGDGWYPNATYQGAQAFPCYAYFSTSFTTVNNTSALSNLTTSSNGGVGNYNDNDCTRLTDALGGFARPFINLNVKTAAGKFEYVNPNSYQIISPGADTLYGTAYKFPASSPLAGTDSSFINGTPAAGAPPGMAGDNFTNFYAGRLDQS